MNFMERDQIKSALINCATTHSISLSELASEAGIAPATLTGFVNDSKSGNRDKHTLSMTTIGKLTKRWPDLADHLKIANPTSNMRQVQYVGMLNPITKKVGGLEPRRSGSLVIQKWEGDYVAYGISVGHPILKQRVYLCKPEPIYENFEHFIDKLLVVDCDEGRMIGFLQQNQNKSFWLAGPSAMWGNNNENNLLDPEKIDSCTNIKWIQPIEWIMP